jgi:hypothetical protein
MKKLFCILLVLMIVIICLPGCSDKESQSATTTVQAGGSQQPKASGENSAQASESSGSEGKKIKPEQLISKEDANKLIGEAVKAGVDDEYPLLGLSSCYYAPENSESKNYLQISVLQKKEEKGSESGGQSESGKSSESSSQGQSGESGGSGGGSGEEEMSPKGLYEGLKKIFSDSNAAVTGHIGDDIFISGKSISILSGEYCIIISVGSADPVAAETMLKDAAEMAVSNMKRIQGK